MPAPDTLLLGPTDLGGMFHHHARDLLRYASGRVGEQVAEDIVAQTFLTAYEQRDRYDPGRGDLLPWLYGICTNLIRRHRRDEQRNLRALQRLSPEVADAPSADGVDAQRAVARVAGTLARLPRRQRDVLLLFAIAQLDYQAIAVALQIPLGSVQSSLHRARAKVRLALGASR
jgi:RNA polymerase sigma-70 factor, ECF subfamily